MKNRALKIIKIIVLVQIVLLGIYIGSDSRLQSAPNNVRSERSSDNVQPILDSGNRMTASLPDVLLSTESGNVLSIRAGRLEEESAESVGFMLGIFLILSVFQFLPNGRLWSAIRSICMDFQDYVMHQIQILQLWDGKKKGFFYS